MGGGKSYKRECLWIFKGVNFIIICNFIYRHCFVGFKLQSYIFFLICQNVFVLFFVYFLLFNTPLKNLLKD